MDLLTAHEAATYLRIGLSTLAQMRAEGVGPPYYRLGRLIRYERGALDEWLDLHRVRPEAEDPR